MMNMPWPIGYQSPLNLDGWLKFNQWKWGVQPRRIRLNSENDELPAVEIVLYHDKNGRIVMPPLNPYLPVNFLPTPTNNEVYLYRQWLRVSKLLVDEFLKCGVKGSVTFPPEVVDVRQWQWHDFLVNVRYTFYSELPYELEKAHKDIRRRIKKARADGFTCDIATKDMLEEVVACLEETEELKGFSYTLTAKDLEMALKFLGEEYFRIYVCKSVNGEIAAADVCMSAPRMRSICLVAGTKRKFRGSGATQLLIWHRLNDLVQQGASGVDFVGANLPTVSSAKSEWGVKLVPYYLVRQLNVRTLGRILLKILGR